MNVTFRYRKDRGVTFFAIVPPPAGQAEKLEKRLEAADALESCRNGFLRLDAGVPDEINARTVARLAELGERLSADLDEPVELFAEPWFVTNVLLNPAVTGAVRSLLGPEFGLPVLLSNHRVETPAEQTGWHHGEPPRPPAPAAAPAAPALLPLTPCS